MDKKEIARIRLDIDCRESNERYSLLREHNIKFSKERLTLYEKCGNIGHEWESFWRVIDPLLEMRERFCKHCGMREEQYESPND